MMEWLYLFLIVLMAVVVELPHVEHALGGLVIFKDAAMRFGRDCLARFWTPP